MQLRESGIILFCERYEDAVKFYSDQLGLIIREQKNGLTILDFGGSYLMIEDNGVASIISITPKTRAENPTVLRLNVIDFDNTIMEMRDRGVSVEVSSFDWGSIGVIIDLEGNKIEIKD